MLGATKKTSYFQDTLGGKAMIKYFIYDYNQYKLFNLGFDTYEEAFDFCLGKFKTDEEMEDIIILPLRRNNNG